MTTYDFPPGCDNLVEVHGRVISANRDEVVIGRKYIRLERPHPFKKGSTVTVTIGSCGGSGRTYLMEAN